MTTSMVLYRTNLGAENYATKLEAEDASVRSARSVMLSADPPQWTVVAQTRDGHEYYARPKMGGFAPRR